MDSIRYRDIAIGAAVTLVAIGAGLAWWLTPNTPAEPAPPEPPVEPEPVTEV